MPWRHIEPMQQREEFVEAYESGLFSLSELCIEYAVSRKTAYKWLARYEQEGVAGLQERSRAPHSCPHQMASEVRQALLKARDAHPHWGPRKLLAVVAKQRPKLLELQLLPAPSTVGDLLRREGRIQPRQRRTRPAHPGSSPLVAAEANALWSVDFKGQFRTQDRRWCYPLTVSDAFTRYLLLCQGCPSTEGQGVRQAFERLFAEVGLPQAIRSDNGTPFCSTALGGLSRLSIWWMKLGIEHQRIRPGQPQENPRHERIHRTLKAEAASPPAENGPAQQVRFDDFRQEYNYERPHEALAMQTPGSLWTPSARPMPVHLPAPEYAGHMQVRRVRHGGEIRFGGGLVFVSEVLANERVALEEVEEGIWSLFFYQRLLARLDERTMRLVPLTPKLSQKVTNRRPARNGHPKEEQVDDQQADPACRPDAQDVQAAG